MQVNVASRMESTSETMKIQVSKMTYKLLQDAPDYQFDFDSAGERAIKGKGAMCTYFVTRRTNRDPDTVQEDSNGAGSSKV